MPDTEQVTPDPGTLFRLDGKRAIIVGGYGGIGRVTTQMFSAAGAAVAIAGRSAEKAHDLAVTLSDTGARAVGVRVDASDAGSVRELVEQTVSTLGGVDILVNLASVDLEAKATEFAEDDWRKVLDINLGGAFWLSQACARQMMTQGQGGRIVHFSSTRSVAGGRRGFAAYAASKGGLNTLIKQLATEWGRAGITVNGIGPGFVPTEMVQHAVQDPQFTNMMLNRIPMGRFGQPVEMASTALFLASPAAAFVTGQILFVDGGVTASS